MTIGKNIKATVASFEMQQIAISGNNTEARSGISVTQCKQKERKKEKRIFQRNARAAATR